MNEEVIQTCLSIIQRHVPTAKEEGIKVLDGGYAHTVFKINNQVFRFPKTKDSEQKQLAESIFSKRFSKISPIPIPVIEHHTDTDSGIAYQTYEFIPGVPFTKEYAASLKKSELLAIAELFGDFLKKLHAISEKEMNNLPQSPTAEKYARYFVDVIEEDKKIIDGLLTPDEWEWIEKNSKAYYALSRNHPFALKITHSDLLPKHILIDEKTHRLSGIIDFALRVIDPAVDLRYFDRYGGLFLQTVYEHYMLDDEYFEERRKFHARDFLVGYLYLAVRDKSEALQNIYLKELQGYIATHPL